MYKHPHKLTRTLQLGEVPIIQIDEAPKLLVEWSSRWDEFFTSIGPALARSGPRLAGEAPHGLFPYRSMLASVLLELFLLFVVAILPRQIDHLRPYAAPKVRPYEVIYYSGDELPRTEDLGGSQTGASGRAGGEEAHHNTQIIRVSRGSSLAAKVVDAPNLNLPSSTGAVANLLAFKSNPAPPSAEGLHSFPRAPSLPANVIAPAPVDMARDHHRSAVTLDSVVPPAPSISADKSRTAPSLNSSVVPPAPSVRSEHALIAPSLASTVIAPASPRISRDQARSTPALNASVIPPAPASIDRAVAPTRVQMNDVPVVPPPVSAPERDTTRNAKLNLPSPSVVAPPPSADSARDLRRLESGGAASSPTVVPPPPTQPGNVSLVSSIIGKLFGTQDVVPPPPTVSSASRNASEGQGNALATDVVPPPPSASAATTGGTSRMSPRASPANIVPPPPSVNGSNTGGSAARFASPGSNVVPPPPTVVASASGGAPGNRVAGSVGSGTGLVNNNIVPPPPSIGSGTGRTGSGLGAPGDAGSVLAPPKGTGEHADNSGIVLSAQPGSSVGVPGTGGKSSLAMSPSGGEKPGVGGSGGGAGIGHGEGPGSGLTGENSGAGKTGAGRGSDPNSRAGISPTPGPGGAGNAPTGTPAVPGVDVRGGSTIVTLPSFGSDGNGGDPNLPGRSSVKTQQGPAITIVATSRSGGAFDFYGKLPGDNYTVYVDTALGTVVMQFAEADPAAHPQAGALIGPQGLRTNLPAGLPHARVVVKCTLDRSGNIRNVQLLEPGPPTMTAKILTALPSWKFRPAMRGTQPVEVNAILGFNIDTNDRY